MQKTSLKYINRLICCVALSKVVQCPRMDILKIDVGFNLALQLCATRHCSFIHGGHLRYRHNITNCYPLLENQRAPRAAAG